MRHLFLPFVIVAYTTYCISQLSDVTPVTATGATTATTATTPAVCTSLSNNVAHKEIWEPITPTNTTPCTFVMNRPEASMLGVNSSQAFRMEEMADVARKTQLECLNAFSRIPGPRGGDFDVFQSGTEASVAPAHTPSIQWCASTAQWRGCRQCGYSCNNLEAAKGGYIDVGIKYPILRTIRVYVGNQQRRVYTDSAEWNVTQMKVEQLEKPGRHLLSRKKGLASPYLTLFGDAKSYDSALTAERMGFRANYRPTEEWNNKKYHTKCLKMVRGITFFFSRRFRMKDVQTNIGHWLHDNYFPMFTVISRYMANMTEARHALNYRVVPFDDVYMKGFKQSWAVGPLAHLLEALLPRRSKLYVKGKCYAQAVFDCAPANSMEPMQPLHRWLRNVHKMDFMPLLNRKTAHAWSSGTLDHPNNMLLMLRKRGTARFIDNYRDMVDTATGLGWNVTVPLNPDAGNGTITHRMLDVLEHLQTCALMVGFHGNELATMFFMPRGSVVVEIVSVYFRYLDAWYIRQAKASSLHLVRWTPSNESISFGPRWRWEEVYMKASAHDRRFFADRASTGEVYEYGARAMRSSLVANIEEWRALLRLASSLLRLPWTSEAD